MKKIPDSKLINLYDRLIQGESAALARIITYFENELPATVEISRLIQGNLGKAMVIGITGAPGAGKSTLINAYIRELRKRKLSVAVAAVDPSSPVTGGAILGDRIRMSEHASDPDVFIRSLSSRGKSGGLSEYIGNIIDVMDAAGKEVVLVETVGTGQSEVEIAEIADVSVVLCPPGLGDGIQAIKSGILEIGDFLVVNKADLPFAEKTVLELKSALELRKEKAVIPVFSTVATTGEGVSSLVDAVASCFYQISRDRHSHHHKRILKRVADTATRNMKNYILKLSEAAKTSLCEKVQSGELTTDQAADLCFKEYIQK
ncbi:MAG: methylmalonyl Co-A mutase-associated GTPase MeaB [SAR324 cluster bacterium]|nr:methylmalonyl Co-A mutase-associated GTPase MeaB [SAR324 cluster bacterium]